MKRETLGVIGFMSVFSAILYVANLVVYEAVATMFDIVSKSQLVVLGVILGVLSGSFIVSTMLGRRYYNALTRTYYMIAASWMGFFAYLFFTSSIYGIIVAIVGNDVP